jgi:putative transcriptional regulator
MDNRIKELRKARGLTQDELAQKLKVSRQTINSLEKGRYDPSITLAHKLARSFGLTIEEVFLFDLEDSQ